MSAPSQPARLAREAGATIRLAAPLALAMLAQVAMGATDTVLLGGLGSDALAAGGLGANLFFTLTIIVSGALISVSIVVSHARGAGDHETIGRALTSGLVFALAISAIPIVVLWNAERVLRLIGEQPELAHAIGRYDRILLLAAPASLFVALQRFYLAAMNRPGVVMAVSLVAVVVNGFLNYGLIYGAWGLPRLGYIGSCTATALTLWAMTIAIALRMRSDSSLRGFPLKGPIDFRILRELATLGWPIAALTATEIMLFSVAGLIVGLFGAVSLAAHQISLNVASITFMVPLAVSQAVNVRVGFHTGRRAPRDARLAALVGFGLGVGFMSLAATMMLTEPELIARLYIRTNDESAAKVVALAVQLLSIAALFQVFDGTQVIAVGALRGLKDTRVPALIAAVGYWAIGFVIAWVLGVHFGRGAVGIWWGLAAGLATVAILLGLRFWRLSGRMIRAELTSPLGGEVGSRGDPGEGGSRRLLADT